jgi:hypothetical protein
MEEKGMYFLYVDENYGGCMCRGTIVKVTVGGNTSTFDSIVMASRPAVEDWFKKAMDNIFGEEQNNHPPMDHADRKAIVETIPGYLEDILNLIQRAPTENTGEKSRLQQRYDDIQERSKRHRCYLIDSEENEYEYPKCMFDDTWAKLSGKPGETVRVEFRDLDGVTTLSHFTISRRDFDESSDIRVLLST